MDNMNKQKPITLLITTVKTPAIMADMPQATTLFT